ncbi:MAG: HEAT repeat domain-containing protein [Nitrospiraceae bacterium]
MKEQIAALMDEDWSVREEAATLLGSYRDHRAVEPLINVLRDPDRAVRTAATHALAAIGETAVPAVGACLDDPNLTVQEAAAAILSAIGDGRVFDPLIAALNRSDWVVRMHAAQALGRIGDVRAVLPLIPLLQDKVKAVRVDAANALALIGQAAVPVLVETLTHQEWLVRLHAVEALGKIKSPDAVEPLLRLMFNDRDAAIRTDAARSLGDIGDPRAVEFLLTAMSDMDVRQTAVEALGKIGDRRAVPALIAVLKGTSRPAQSRAIDGCGDRWDAEVLTMAAATRALAQIQDENVIPTLVAALQSTLTRSEAASALVTFGPPAIPFLLDVLKKERDENILYYAKEALQGLGWRPNRL